MLRIATLNCNGLRSAERKGFSTWLRGSKADVVCLQEIKLSPALLDRPEFQFEGYHCFYAAAQKPGYSGVALLSRKKPLHLRNTLGWNPMDDEGRFLRADFEELSVVSLYLPSEAQDPSARL